MENQQTNQTNQSISYTLTRSNRKSVSIYIRDAKVEVKAPFGFPKCRIDRIILSKREWIQQNLSKSEINTTSKNNFRLDYKSRILYLGNEYMITPSNKTAEAQTISGDKLFLEANLSSDEIKSSCIDFYKKAAEKLFEERVDLFSKQIGITPRQIKISNAEKQWGSCCSAKIVHFSWRLVMADINAIDYVVVHELSHLYEMNHSERFWGIVKNTLPDYEKQKKVLSTLYKRLVTENWRETKNKEGEILSGR